MQNHSHLTSINYKIIFLFIIILLNGCGGSSDSKDDVVVTPPITFPPVILLPEVTDYEQNAYNNNFTSAHFSGSNTCATCHNGIRDNAGNDLSIVKDWSASMMANAAKDPLWKAKVKSEMNRNPQLSEVIADKCTRCHMPMASIESHYDNKTVKLFDDGFLDPNHERHDEAMDGVSCTLCHQIADNDTFGTEEGMSGHFAVEEQRYIYGQYSDVLTRPMQNNVNYTPTYSKHVSSAELCASCHDLKTPFVDESGTLVADKTFPEQMPYSEWEASDFNDEGPTPSTCQQCHMPQVNDASVRISTFPNGATQRDQFSQHLFLGANTYMLSILKNNGAELNTEHVSFDNLITRNREFLTTAGSVDVINSSLVNDELIFDIQVNNVIGHKLPTAYPSRRVYLHIVIKNDVGEIVFESGKTQNNGSIDGNNADIDRTQFEPHYQVITSADQVQIYETVMGNVLDKVTYTLLEAGQYLKDNRILPHGFNKETVPEDIAVYGLANTDDNFIQGKDSLRYQVDVSQFSSNYFSVDITLNYQPVAYSFLQDLFEDESIAVERFKKYNESAVVKFETIAEQSIQINR
ncbi:MAG: multiheme c-type cytochrome [Colwellia sp.]|nr:multiheme c-type cytochrome [Colwellia sp.]